jgi:hypothetical protein
MVWLITSMTWFSLIDHELKSTLSVLSASNSLNSLRLLRSGNAAQSGCRVMKRRPATTTTSNARNG